MKTPSRMRVIRFRRGMSLDDLSLLTGLDRGWLSRAERGIVGLNQEHREKISLALNFPLEGLFPESER
jgi:transcriptional regulator with XRE-family HTH domain